MTCLSSVMATGHYVLAHGVYALMVKQVAQALGPHVGSVPLVHGSALGLRVHVGVDVQGHRYACVSQVARHGPHVVAACDHHGGEGVPEVVEGTLEAVYLAEGGEVLAELRGVVGSALLLLRPQDVGVAEGKHELVSDAHGVRPHESQYVEGAPREGYRP